MQLQEIQKGFSPDKKYLATDENGKKFFLRVEKDDNRQLFEWQKDLFFRGIQLAQPLTFNRIDGYFHSLYEWIEGDTANNCIHNYDEKTQYQLGYSLGRQIKKLHQLPIKETIDWETSFTEMTARVLSKFETMGIDFDGKDFLIDTLKNSLHLTKNRPTAFLHGDLSDGNVMITKDGGIKLIDFIDDHGYGDPWKEFSKIINTAGNCPIFAKGQIDGYFEGEVPAEFWELLKIYSCYQGLEAVVWSGPLKQEGLTNWLVNVCKNVAIWYGDGGNVPSWYKSNLSK